MLGHRHDDVQVVQLEELEEVEHEQDPDTRDARPSNAPEDAFAMANQGHA